MDLAERAATQLKIAQALTIRIMREALEAGLEYEDIALILSIPQDIAREHIDRLLGIK